MAKSPWLGILLTGIYLTLTSLLLPVCGMIWRLGPLNVKIAAHVYGLRLLWQDLIILTLLGATPVLLQSLCSVFLTGSLLLVAVLLGTFYALFLVSYVV